MVRTSIIIPANNEGNLLNKCIESIIKRTPSKDYEIIVIDDGSTDGCCDFLAGNRNIKLLRTRQQGPARARNYGASYASGRFFVFLDANCEIVEPGWLAGLISVIRNRDVICGGSLVDTNHRQPPCFGFTLNKDLTLRRLTKRSLLKPYAVPCAPGGCMAVRRETFWNIGGFSSSFRSWGYDDMEICLKAWLSGIDVLVNPRVVIGHYFRDASPRPITQHSLNKNALTVTLTYFGFTNILRILRNRIQYKYFIFSLLRILAGNVWKQRKYLRKRMKRNDKWFLERFGIRL
jgi:glycosyltransferase involved in cell wall biosynthesis